MKAVICLDARAIHATKRAVEIVLEEPDSDFTPEEMGALERAFTTLKQAGEMLEEKEGKCSP